MARNTTSMHSRVGAVKDRSQVYNPHNNRWTKRGPDGKFMDQKADNEPFKGVTRENTELEQQINQLSQVSPILFLSGGGDNTQSHSFDNLYRKELGGKRILYIPRAMYPESYEDCLSWINTVFPKAEGYKVTLLYPDEKIDNSLIDQHDGLYIGGGNTFRLLHLLRKTEFDKLINEAIVQQKPIYGGSAGGIIFGYDINTACDINTVRLSRKQSLGFDIILGYSIICHYKGKRSEDNEIMEYRKNHSENPVIALPEGVGCCVMEGKILVGGEGVASIFTGEGKITVSTGDEIQF